MPEEKNVQELYMEFQVLEQHIKQLQNQLEALTGQLIELSATSSSLDDFSRITSEKEAFVPLSSGIFAKASIKGDSALLVNVGANVVVQKDAASTKKLIQGQIEGLKKIQMQMISELEKMTKQAAQLEMQLQSMMPQQ